MPYLSLMLYCVNKTVAEQSEPPSSRCRSKSLDERKSTVEENVNKKDYHTWDARDVNQYFNMMKVWEILDQPLFKTLPKAKDAFKGKLLVCNAI